MYYCVDCKRYFDNIVIEAESCGVDNMSGIVEYCYCPLCGSSHCGLPADSIYFRQRYDIDSEDDEDE